MTDTAAWVSAVILAPAFLTWMTWVAKQLWSIRQEVTGIHSAVDDLERRVESLEKIAHYGWFDGKRDR